MKTYKARFKEMNEYYLQRIRVLQDRLHSEKIALKQIHQLYQGYVAQIILKYGLDSDRVYLDPEFPILDYGIRAEQSKDRRIRLKVIKLEEEVEEEEKEPDEEPEEQNDL